jgi:hypothetical protein
MKDFLKHFWAVRPVRRELAYFFAVYAAFIFAGRIVDDTALSFGIWPFIYLCLWVAAAFKSQDDALDA